MVVERKKKKKERNVLNAFRCDIGLCSYVVILVSTLASVSRVKNELSIKVLQKIITVNCQFHDNWVAPSAEEDCLGLRMDFQ